MADNEEQGQQQEDELEEDLSQAQETGAAKGAGISPGTAGQSHAGGGDAEGGQVPPA